MLCQTVKNIFIDCTLETFRAVWLYGAMTAFIQFHMPIILCTALPSGVCFEASQLWCVFFYDSETVSLTASLATWKNRIFVFVQSVIGALTVATKQIAQLSISFDDTIPTGTSKYWFLWKDVDVRKHKTNCVSLPGK